MRKLAPENLERFVGHYAYGIYPAPAVSCCANGRMVRREGKVERVATDRHGRTGVVIEGSVFTPSEIKCPALHWEGEAYTDRN